MSVTSLRRWHWMVIGLLAGALDGFVREGAANFYDELLSYGPRRIGQREFEAAVTTRFHGKARFCDLTVRPYRLAASGGPRITVHVVSGLYWDGKTQAENGRVSARWDPAYFVASAPYFPDPIPARTSTAQFENVMAYLRSSPGGEPIPFAYASWWWAARPQFPWTFAGVAVIGGVWPTIGNLLAFGTLSRPREAKGVSLWPARPATASAQPAPAELDPAVMTALERGLSADAPTDPPPAVPPTPAIRTLRGDAEPAAAPAPADGHPKDYGKAEEDFYPTELRANHGA